MAELKGNKGDKITKTGGVAGGNIPGGVTALSLMEQKILKGEFASGQTVRESSLAEEFGMNRNAVRTALNQLVAWNIFEYAPFCGYKVRDFGLKALQEWFEMRWAIEPAAARRLAAIHSPKIIADLQKINRLEYAALKKDDIIHAGQLDQEFHYAIVAQCGNSTYNWIQNVCRLQYPFLQGVASANVSQHCLQSEGIEYTYNSHEKIIAAIESGSLDQAENEARAHCSIALNRIAELVIYL